MALAPHFLLAQNSKILLTPEEQNWLDQKHIVRIRIGNWPPFMFSDGEFKGITIDYIRKIFSTHDIKYQFLSDKDFSWNAALENIKTHQDVDMLPTAKVTDARKKHMIFTDEYLFLSWVIFTRDDAPFIGGMNDLAGKTICAPEGYEIHRLLKKHYPEIKIKLISGDNLEPRCLKELALGKVNAYIGNLAVGSYVIQNHGYSNIKVAAPTSLGDHNQAMAIRKDWPELASIINKTLKSIPPAEHAQLRNKWLSVRYEHGIRKADIVKWVLVATAIFIPVLFVILFWNHKLNNEVQERQRAERDLLESEYKYRTLSDAAYEGIVLIEDEIIIEANNAIAMMYGYSDSNEVIGKRAFEFVAPVHREKVKQMISTGFDKPYQVDGLKNDGSSFPIEIHGKLFPYRGKQLRVTAIRDLTEQKKREEEIKKLQGIIPICMFCKGIRDDHGSWNQLEKYISEHSEAEFSHGICEKCMKEHYPQYIQNRNSDERMD